MKKKRKVSDLTLRVRGTGILVRPRKAPSVTKGGVILPEDARRMPQFGEVVVVAPGVQGLVAGDIVVYPMYAGIEISVPNQKGLDEVLLHMDEKNAVIVLTGAVPGYTV